MEDIAERSLALIGLTFTAIVACACSDAVGDRDASGGGAGGSGAAGASGATSARGEQRNALAVSPSHACALRSTGLFCWGENVFGALGTGDVEPAEVPVLAAAAGPDVVDLAVSTGRTCVRRSSGEVACWGANDRGQIGDGTRNPSMVAVPASGIGDAIAMAIDDASTCVLRRDHTVACWGQSPDDAPGSGSPVPQAVPGLSDIEELRNGMLGTYCARSMASQVWCWRFKDGAWTAPAEVAALAGSRAVALAAWDEVCAISGAGDIRCHNFDSGKTIPLEGSESAVAVRGAGGLAACGLNASGEWRCWNVLPPMLETLGSTPIPIRSDMMIEDLVLGGFRVCGLRADRSVACADASKLGLMPLPEFAELTVVDGLPH